MKRDDIEGVLYRYLQQGTNEDVKSDCDRIFSRIESSAPSRVSKEVFTDSERARFLTWKRLAMVSAAAAILAAVMGAITWRHAQPFAIVESADGSSYRIVEGQTVQTNGGGAMVLLVDGSRVEMRSHSELTLDRATDGLRIRLGRGDVIVNAAKQAAGHLYVQTKDVTVSVVGTVFLVNAEEEGSRVAVIEGKVRVRQGTTEKQLRPGEQVASNPALLSRPVSEEISWSRNAETHIAQLQLSTASPAQTPATSRIAFEEVSIRPSLPRDTGGGRGGVNPYRLAGCSGDLTLDPARFVATRVSVYTLVLWAYGSKSVGDCLVVSQIGWITGGSDWVRADEFDIQAVIPAGSPAYTRQQLLDGEAPTLQEMIRTMLSERFKLGLRREMKNVPVFALVPAKDGPKRTTSPEGDRWIGKDSGKIRYPISMPNPSPGRSTKGVAQEIIENRMLWGRKATIEDLTPMLGRLTRRPVVDRTGLTGEFNFDLEFTLPDDGTSPIFRNVVMAPVIFTAIQEQLGLRLEDSRAPVEMLTIDRVEKPSEN